MGTAVWRYVLSAFALFALFIAVGDAFDAGRIGDIGFTYDAASESKALVQDVEPDSQAARTGVRSGDTISAEWLRWDAVFGSENPLGIRVGQRVTFYDARLRRNVTVVAVPLTSTFAPARVFAHILAIVVLLLALLLYWTLPADRAARALSTFLIFYELQGFGNGGSFALGSNGSAWILEITGQLMLLPLVLFACWFPNRYPAGALRTISVAATALGAATFAITLMTTAYAQFGKGPHLPDGHFVWVTSYLLPVLFGAMLVTALALDLRTASQLDRLRLEWLIFGTALVAYAWIGLTYFPALFLSFGGYFNTLGLVATDVFDLVGVGCIAYAFFRYRVLDLTFAVSRATVYALLSTVIVAAFVLVEFLVGKYVERQSHITGAIITLAFALALGIGFRTLHRHVDTFVDRLIFRSKYRAEEALRTFGRRAAFFTNERGLQETTVAALLEYARAQSAAIYLIDPDGDFTLSACAAGKAAAQISHEDPAVLALKDERRPQFIPVSSQIDGELIFPMQVRGELMGFVTCGKRRVRESYTPDEIEAMNYALEHVGIQLDAIRTAQLQKQLHAIQQLLSSYEVLGADPARVLAQIWGVSGGNESRYEDTLPWKTPTKPDGQNAPKTSSTT